MIHFHTQLVKVLKSKQIRDHGGEPQQGGDQVRRVHVHGHVTEGSPWEKPIPGFYQEAHSVRQVEATIAVDRVNMLQYNLSITHKPDKSQTLFGFFPPKPIKKPTIKNLQQSKEKEN
jgi:hypothetical protein